MARRNPRGIRRGCSIRGGAHRRRFLTDAAGVVARAAPCPHIFDAIPAEAAGVAANASTSTRPATAIRGMREECVTILLSKDLKLHVGFRGIPTTEPSMDFMFKLLLGT